MISQITEPLFIGEFLDVASGTKEEVTAKIAALRTLGITDVFSLLAYGIEDHQIEKEKEALYPQPFNDIAFHLCPVPAPLKPTRKLDPFKVGLATALRDLTNVLNLRPNAKVLVNCTAGMDRSPFLVACYLAEQKHIDLADAYAEIKKVRPFICEHYEWLLIYGIDVSVQSHEVEKK